MNTLFLWSSLAVNLAFLLGFVFGGGILYNRFKTMQGQLTALQEDVADLRKEIREFREELTDSIHELRVEVKGVKVKLDGLEKRFDGLEKRVAANTDNLTGLALGLAEPKESDAGRGLGAPGQAGRAGDRTHGPEKSR